MTLAYCISGVRNEASNSPKKKDARRPATDGRDVGADADSGSAVLLDLHAHHQPSAPGADTHRLTAIASHAGRALRSTRPCRADSPVAKKSLVFADADDASASSTPIRPNSSAAAPRCVGMRTCAPVCPPGRPSARTEGQMGQVQGFGRKYTGYCNI